MLKGTVVGQLYWKWRLFASKLDRIVSALSKKECNHKMPGREPSLRRHKMPRTD